MSIRADLLAPSTSFSAEEIEEAWLLIEKVYFTATGRQWKIQDMRAECDRASWAKSPLLHTAEITALALEAIGNPNGSH